MHGLPWHTSQSIVIRSRSLDEGSPWSGHEHVPFSSDITVFYSAANARGREHATQYEPQSRTDRPTPRPVPPLEGDGRTTPVTREPALVT